MATAPFKITLHMVSSLDGMIAKKDNSVSWFETADHYEKGITVSDHDAAEFLKTIDCYIMGARTYEHALELSKAYGWPYGDIPTIVLSHRNLPITRPNIRIQSSDLHQLVAHHLKPHYSNVWVVGGTMLVKDFIRNNLADEIRVTILPIILGDGLPFFDQVGQEHALHLEDATAYKNGTVELRYQIKK